jgi:hypothetical protein
MREQTTKGMKNNFRILLFLSTFSISSNILFSFTPVNAFNKKELLSMLVSVISIIVAIIVTYLFSKLFAEKTIRIERKKEIDEYSKKVTYLRRMAFQIRKMYSFWRHEGHDLKAIMDNQFPDLLYEEYRGYERTGLRKFTYKELSSIDQKIFGSDGQGYLALKALEDNENDFSFYSEFNPKNYSLDDIARYKEYANSFWYFLDQSDREVYKFERANRYHLNFIEELYLKITGTQINQNEYRKNIKDLFSSFEEGVFQKHYYLSNLNSDTFPEIFRVNFLNMLMFLILLIFSLVFYTIQLNNIPTYKITILILSLFISNAVDLITIVYQSIRHELNVKEVFKI